MKNSKYLEKISWIENVVREGILKCKVRDASESNILINEYITFGAHTLDVKLGRGGAGK